MYTNNSLWEKSITCHNQVVNSYKNNIFIKKTSKNKWKVQTIKTKNLLDK